jgi:Tfp pilus assembly protein PilO
MKQPLKRQPGKPKTWLTTGLLASIAIGYVVFVFLPSQRSIGELRSQVQERRQQIMQAQSMQQTVTLAKQRLAETQAVRQQWRAEAPRPTELITRVASLTQQAEAAGVAIDRLDPLPALELNLIAQQNMTVQFHATFAAVFDLLRRLEAMPGTIWIRNLRLQTPGEAGNLLRGELTVTIFVNRTDYSD